MAGQNGLLTSWCVIWVCEDDCIASCIKIGDLSVS